MQDLNQVIIRLDTGNILFSHRSLIAETIGYQSWLHPKRQLNVVVDGLEPHVSSRLRHPKNTSLTGVVSLY